MASKFESQNPSASVQQDPYGPHYGYNQPPAEYPPQQGYGAPQYPTASVPPPPAPQQMVVVGQPQPIIVHQVPSYAGHIVFACFVFWCCNPLFGLIAFILSSQCRFIRCVTSRFDLASLLSLSLSSSSV